MKVTERSAAGPTCVYIVSRGHSGSTLLEMLLGRHSKVASAGELANLSLQCVRDEHTMWRGQCSCGERPFDCPIWSVVLDSIEREYGVDMRTRPFDFKVSDVGLEEEYRYAAPWRVPYTWARNVYWRLLRYQQYTGPAPIAALARLHVPQQRWACNRSFVLSKIAELRNAVAVIDSSKDPLGMRDLYDYAPLPVKILFLTRDCRGNVWSVAKHAKQPSARKARVTSAARDWVAVNGRIQRLVNQVPREDWMHVQYEELCRSPAETLEAIFRFIGVPYEPAVLDHQEHLEHTIAGNQIRFSNKQAKITEDTAWQKYLDPEDLARINAIAAPLARNLRYEL